MDSDQEVAPVIMLFQTECAAMKFSEQVGPAGNRSPVSDELPASAGTSRCPTQSLYHDMYLR